MVLVEVRGKLVIFILMIELVQVKIPACEREIHLHCRPLRLDQVKKQFCGVSDFVNPFLIENFP